MSTTLVPLSEYLGTSYPDGDREFVDGQVVERNMGEIDHGDVQGRLLVYLATNYKAYWAAPEVRMRVAASRYRVPDIQLVTGAKPRGRVVTEPPFLVVEVLSPDDRAADLEEKLADYFRFGVRYVWVINPRSRRANIHTAEGSREAGDGILSTENPAIQVPVSALFD